MLSKAFRNRFLEMHVGDIPDDELAAILEHRCQVRVPALLGGDHRALRSAASDVRREETFFPRMIDADSTKADRASPLERFYLASTSNPMPPLGFCSSAYATQGERADMHSNCADSAKLLHQTG